MWNYGTAEGLKTKEYMDISWILNNNYSVLPTTDYVPPQQKFFLQNYNFS